MSKNRWITFAIITIICSIICLCFLLFFYKQEFTLYFSRANQNGLTNLSDLSDLTYFRLKDDLSNTKGNASSLEVIDTVKQALVKNNIHMSKTCQDASFYFFESLNHVDEIVGTTPYGPNCKFIFGIAGTDHMASKSLLAIHLKNALGNDSQAAPLPIPTTYVYGNKVDMDLLKHAIATTVNKGGAFILKKNIQRQTGLLITRDPLIIMNGGQDGYVVCQQLLMDPLIVANRKTNFRIYLLVVVRNGSTGFYIYDDGFMYYSPELWKGDDDLNPDIHITTGFMKDRTVYEENPLTLQDLRTLLTPSFYDPMWQNIVNLFKKVKKTFTPILQKENKGIPGIKFSIFGADVAADSKGNVLLVELNKGCSLDSKDERDGALKLAMVENAFVIAGIMKTKKTNNFILL